MLHIKLVCIGRMKEKYLMDAAAEYIKRLRIYCKLEITELAEEVPAAGAAPLEKALEKEAAGIVKEIGEKAFVCALCVEGDGVSSEQLSEKLGSVSNTYPRIVFIIGGSNGLSEKIKKRADLRISMSAMTFPHHLARVMLLEQIYRAFKISEGSCYHK